MRRPTMRTVVARQSAAWWWWMRRSVLHQNWANPHAVTMMEAPDLLHIGDDARIDQAVLIADLDARGEWMMGRSSWARVPVCAPHPG